MKQTSTTVFLGFFALAFIFAVAPPTSAQTDLSMRQALYFTGSKSGQIDLKNDPFVTNGGTMDLKTNNAVSCTNSVCTFNIGFIAFRSGSTQVALSSYALFTAETGLVGNTVYFAEGMTVRQGVLPLRLKLGPNKVSFSVDPYKKVPETNEGNNSISVNFNVSQYGKP